MARFTHVERNLAISVNDESPRRIVAQWHDPETHKDHVFHSANLFMDPTPFVPASGELAVFIHPTDPRKHYMDLSFVPGLR